MDSNNKEMSWQEIAILLDGANIVLAQNFNRLTVEYSRLLMQCKIEEKKGIKKGKNKGSEN